MDARGMTWKVEPAMNRLLIPATLLVTALAVSGCVPTAGGAAAVSTSATAPTLIATAATAGTLPVGNPHAPMPAPNTCRLGSKNGQDNMPDPKCTPGATNPNVTQATITTTICQPGWTSTVRPSTNVTSRMKKLSAESYGIAATGEYDHLVSLELGGAPDDPRNLWVEPGGIPNPKDAVENKLKAAVCANLVPLATAQQAIAVSWPTAYDDAGLRVAGGKVCLRDNPSRCVK